MQATYQFGATHVTNVATLKIRPLNQLIVDGEVTLRFQIHMTIHVTSHVAL